MVNVTASCRNSIFHSAAMIPGAPGTQFGNQKSSGNDDLHHHPRRDDGGLHLAHTGSQKLEHSLALCTAHARESLCCPGQRFNDVFVALSLPISLAKIY